MVVATVAGAYLLKGGAVMNRKRLGLLVLSIAAISASVAVAGATRANAGKPVVGCYSGGIYVIADHVRVGQVRFFHTDYLLGERLVAEVTRTNYDNVNTADLRMETPSGLPAAPVLVSPDDGGWTQTSRLEYLATAADPVRVELFMLDQEGDTKHRVLTASGQCIFHGA